MAFETGPHLSAAVLCERVLEEKDGVLTLVRLVDRIIVTAQGPDAPTSLPPTVVNFWIVVSLKSGAARGRSVVKIRPEQPSGQQMDPIELTVHFEGEDRGANLILNMGFNVEQEGLYWFDILLDERLITRVPLRILYQRQTAGSQ